MNRGRCPCECQIALECRGRGLQSPPQHATFPPVLLLPISLSFPFFLCASLILFFTFWSSFQPPLAHCSPHSVLIAFFLFFFFFLSSPLSVPVLHPFSISSLSLFRLFSSVCFFFFHVPVLHLSFFSSLFFLNFFLYHYLLCICSVFRCPLSFFLLRLFFSLSLFFQYTHSPSWLTPHFILNLSLSLYTLVLHPHSPVSCLSFFHVPVLLPGSLVSLLSLVWLILLSDRQVLVTVETSSSARMFFGSAVPDLQPACPTFKWAVSLQHALSVPLDSRIAHLSIHARLLWFAWCMWFVCRACVAP